MTPRTVTRKKVAAVIVGAAAVGFAVGAITAPKAAADPGAGCETISWGFLWSQRRTICDSPRYPDGHWDRLRIIWTPAHTTPITCSGGIYYSSCWGGQFVPESKQEQMTYPVTDANVLEGEPGWLPAGTEILR